MNSWISILLPFCVLFGIWIYAEGRPPKWKNSKGINEWIAFIPLYVCAFIIFYWIVDIFNFILLIISDFFNFIF